jgi:hypothetical protein
VAVGTTGQIDPRQLAHQLQRGLGSRVGGRGGNTQQLTAVGEGVFLGAVGEETKVANAHESRGQGVKQEASDEHSGLQGQRLQGIAVFAVAVGEGDLAIFDRKNPVVGNRHPMGIAAQVIENFLRRREGLLGIDVPVLSAERLD